MQPPEGTTQAHFSFPEPPFELVGELTVPFDVETGDDAEGDATER